MTPETKVEMIDEILKNTGSEPTKYFDRLVDKSDRYLKKLVKITKLLKDKNAL